MDMKSTYFWSVAISATCIKFLLLPSYRSTDFEVHRNWLSITHNLPLSEWYTDSTSQWTLDYPPLFAWFEYGLSQLAFYFDPQMLKISSTPYLSTKTILFQRLTVIATDIFFVYAGIQWCEIIKHSRLKVKVPDDKWIHPIITCSILFFYNPGLFIIDHIHFQYNGFLTGILLLSMARMIQKRELESAFWFALLINLKHIYLYVAPAYFVYLVGNYCYDLHMNFKRDHFIKLALVVSSVFIVSMAPFIYVGQLSTVLARLFPFKRGLTHAYWAPNFWAAYNSMDKFLSVLLKIKSNDSAAMTGGLVQEYHHQILPDVPPLLTLLLVTLSMMPVLYKLWEKRNLPEANIAFIRAVIICAACSFLFGWHVHEKAILMVIILLVPLALLNKEEANIFNILSTVGHFSLFPILYREAETPTKILILLMYCVYSFNALGQLHSSCMETQASSSFIKLLNRMEILYLFGLIFVQFYYSLGHQLIGLDQRYPFLPLMLISSYCSVGVLYSFIKLYHYCLKI